MNVANTATIVGVLGFVTGCALGLICLLLY